MQPTLLYAALRKQYGPVHSWWPARSRFEVIVGAILTQNTAWRNVEIAIKNIRDSNSLSIEAIANMELRQLQRMIRPAGFYRQKADRLRGVARHFTQKYSGDLDKFFKRPVWRSGTSCWK